MSDLVTVTGMVLSAGPVGDFDKRIVLLTKERGKIACFAKGARRQNSPLMGITRPFAFGTYTLYEGRTSYTLRNADVTRYFEEVAGDLDALMVAYYFAEIADYYGREGLDASEGVNLLYAALLALCSKKMNRYLIRYTYELKAIQIAGEIPDFFDPQSKWIRNLSPSAVYALQFIVTTPLSKLFSFNVTDEVLRELKRVAAGITTECFDKKMKSAELLETLR